MPVILIVLTVAAGAVHAAPPAVDWLYPAGGQQGTTVAVIVGGKPAGAAASSRAEAKIEPWPAKVWVDAPGIEFKPADANGVFTVTIAKDAPVGPHLVRVYNGDGASAPRVFVVGRHPEVLEKEPNDDFHQAQPLGKLPAVVNGQLDKPGDADSFAVEAEAGQWIVAELLCRRLNAPVDPALHLLDPDGTEIAFNHDTFGFDPLVACRAPRSGRYVVRVVGFTYPPAADVRFAGAKGAAYRLLVTTGPYARYALPLGVRRGAKTPLELFGWNLPSGGGSVPYTFDATGVSARATSVLVSPPEIDNAVSLPIDDLPQQTACGPNQSPGHPTSVQLPLAITGRIARAGDVARFAFAATKGERFTFAVTSAALGFPLDAYLKVEDSSGKQLARDDDSNGGQDPKLDWTAPADGTYVLALSDLNHQGGDDYVYRLEMRRATPDFAASVDAASVRLEPGKSAELKVTVTRQGGHNAPLAIVATRLPDGVTAAVPEVPSGGGKGNPVTLTLAAAAGAKAANVPVRVMVVGTDEAHPASRAATFDLGADQAIRRMDVVWLTVAPASPATKPATKRDFP